MAFRLPPLNSLRMFEAAARHNSFRKAADELNITASAVSHGIQTLENWLGVELFVRLSRGLQLTSAGELYLPVVHQALGLLATATDHLPGRKPTGTLSLSSAPTFASKILLPRLDKFMVRYPQIRLTIDTSHRLVDLALDEFDAAIRYCSIEMPAPDWTCLMAETLLPVASPLLVRRFPDQPLDQLLSKARLIHVTSASADWNHWFRATGREVPASIEGWLRVDTMQMAFDAAIRGLGIVLGRLPLVDDDIASGCLVPLDRQPIPSNSGYWLVTAQSEFQKPEVKLFRQWLSSEFDTVSEHRKSDHIRPTRALAARRRQARTGR